jgi:hypothetical protein
MAYKQLLLSYTVLDDPTYRNGALRFIRGDAAADIAEVASLDSPKDSGVPILPTSEDPAVFSFVYNGEVRYLLAKRVAPPPESDTPTPTSTSYSLLSPPTPPYGSWGVLSKDSILQHPLLNPATVATNPHGVAQVMLPPPVPTEADQNLLYIVDNASQKIYILDANGLNGLSDGAGYVLPREPFDLTATLNDPNAKGQAIIALKDGNGSNFLYALYLSSDKYGRNYAPSQLVKLSVGSDGSLTYVTKTEVGINAQEIIPVAGTPGGGYADTVLLIPAIGGRQKNDGTNGLDSNISAVPAFGAAFAATTLLTGDVADTPPTAYDIRAVAVSASADDNSILYILTGSYDEDYHQNWTLYKTSVSVLLGAGGAALTDTFGPKEFQADGAEGDPSGYYWDILYENGTNPLWSGDRLWLLRGSPIQATPAGIYGTPIITFPRGRGDGDIGGFNVNSADLAAETLRQYGAGVSLKRGLRGAAPPKAAAEEAEEQR